MTGFIGLSHKDGVTAVDALHPLPVSSEVDSSGAAINPNAYTQNVTYNQDGTVATKYFTDGTNTWTQTYTYTNGKVTSFSPWVKS